MLIFMMVILIYSEYNYNIIYFVEIIIKMIFPAS